MKDFFLNNNKNLIISIFSDYHIALIILTFLIICLVINNRNIFINMDIKNKKRIRHSLAIILLINLVLRRGSFIYYGVYDWHYHLDINVCNFTSILFIIYGLTGYKKIYNLCFYMCFIGPLLSILLPSVNLSPLNYSFYSFVIIHHVIFIYNIIFMFNENLKIEKNNIKNVILFLIIYFFIIYIFNLIFKTTYNMPLTFLNNDIENIDIFSKILTITNIEYFIMIGLIIFLIMFATKILKIFNYKK